MKSNKEDIAKIVKKLLKDIDFKYFEDRPLVVEYSRDCNYSKYGYEKKEGWFVDVEWFDPYYLGGKETTVTILVDDDSNLPFLMLITFGQGGPVLFEQDKNGKFIRKDFQRK